jgi:hypothetical protein
MRTPIALPIQATARSAIRTVPWRPRHPPVAAATHLCAGSAGASAGLSLPSARPRETRPRPAEQHGHADALASACVRRRAVPPRPASSHAPIRSIGPSRTSLGPRVKNRAAPSAIFFQKTESDLTSTALARVRRLDCRGEGLLVRMKLAGGSTKANGRVSPGADMRLVVELRASGLQLRCSSSAFAINSGGTSMPPCAVGRSGGLAPLRIKAPTWRNISATLVFCLIR